MIGFLEGTLRELTTDRALILAGGVGYLVHIPLSTYYKLEGSTACALQIYTHVREDVLSLYGFATPEERFAFEKLISISGIGPRLAQVVLSGIEPADLAEAIVRGDARRLSSIPGVGKKTSERICLELRDKFVLPGERTDTPLPRATSVDEDVQSALVNLGYRAQTADGAITAARKELGDQPELSTLLRASLRHLTK